MTCTEEAWQTARSGTRCRRRHPIACASVLKDGREHVLPCFLMCEAGNRQPLSWQESLQKGWLGARRFGVEKGWFSINSVQEPGVPFFSVALCVRAAELTSLRHAGLCWRLCRGAGDLPTGAGAARQPAAGLLPEGPNVACLVCSVCLVCLLSSC